jgi:hypothetical protein
MGNRFARYIIETIKSNRAFATCFGLAIYELLYSSAKVQPSWPTRFYTALNNNLNDAICTNSAWNLPINQYISALQDAMNRMETQLQEDGDCVANKSAARKALHTLPPTPPDSD